MELGVISPDSAADEQKNGILPLRRANLVDQVHDELHRRITDRLLPAGERIVIDRLALELGVSLVPIREALARLKAERLVTHEANKGYRVAPAPEPFEMRQLFEARLLIEKGSLEQGFDRITDQTVAQMATINDQIRKGHYGANFNSFRAFIDLNAAFHATIVGLTGNSFIISAYSQLGYHQRVAQTLYGRGPDNIEQIVAEHDAVIDGLRRRDLGAARRALSTHILNGLEPYLRLS